MKNNNKTTKQTYIQTIEASIIYEYSMRDSKLKTSRDGAVPYSLELIKLRKEGLEEFKIGKWNNELKSYEYECTNELAAREMKKINKFHSDDIINVKFETSVKNRKDTIKAIRESIERTVLVKRESGESEEAIELYLEEKEQTINEIEFSTNDNWDKSLNEELLRKWIYSNGFTLPNYRGELIHYVPYKRSSAKARVGNILFINEKLNDKMVNWSRMGIDINLNDEIDTPSLMAYEALVTSSIKDRIKINPKNILIITDVASAFKQPANEVKIIDGQLEAVFNPEGKFNNELFDGQALLDSSYFTDGKGMMLLRQHFFKSCAFNVNVIQFFKDQFGDAYETATVKDMFGNKVKVKDIHMITTPSSLKVFKFSNLVGDDKAMYKHWKKVVNADESLFGICKNESTSKRGYKLQQMSYQMVNSLPTDKQGIKKLATKEIEHINAIKDDNELFIEHLEATANRLNANEAFVELYKRNHLFARTNEFNEFKKKTISQYVTNVKSGKVRISGDYCVMVGNPYEMLLHAIGKLDITNTKELTLQGSQVYTKLFRANTKLVGFRNPHTSANNIYSCENVSNELLERYMNFSENIVAVNVIENPINDILSGADFDSDTVLLTDNEVLVEIAESNNFLPCINDISGKKLAYTLNPEDRAIVDKAINSNLIGLVVNSGQLAQSIMYDARFKGNEEVAAIAEKKLEIMNVLSTIAIDLAKKSFDIDPKEEFKRIDKDIKELAKINSYDKILFPNFMTKKENNEFYNTPMDYLIDVMDENINRQKGLYDAVNIMDLLMPCDENGEPWDLKKVSYGQEAEVLEIVQNYSNRYKELRAKRNSEDKGLNSFYENEILIENERFRDTMSRRSVNQVTMFAMMQRAFETGKIDITAPRLLNTLYLSSPKNLINLFQKNDL